MPPTYLYGRAYVFGLDTPTLNLVPQSLIIRVTLLKKLTFKPVVNLVVPMLRLSIASRERCIKRTIKL